MTRIFSVGHSARSGADFLELLQLHGIERLADVRRFPFSRRHPQFHRGPLRRALERSHIEYRHLGRTLGGYTEIDYEQYVGTAPFEIGLGELERFGRGARTAFMCAEKLPWRCHRRHIGRALAVRGWDVLHILDHRTLWSPEQPFWLAPESESRELEETEDGAS